MKKLLGFGMLALMAGMSVNSVSTQIAESNVQKTVKPTPRNLPSENQPLQQTKISKQIRSESIDTSYSPIYYSNEGISPKQYGMYHVKKGTHKRTNV